MDFELPEELKLLKNTVRNFVDRELIPVEMHSMDGPSLRPEIRADLERKAKDLGLWLLDVPTEYGGQGLSLLGLAVVWEEVARSIALPPRGPGVFGPDVRPILFKLNPAQKEKYLYPVLRGEKITAFAQSEPDAGSDPGSMRTTAVRKGDHYVINGYKRWITKAHDADFLQLVAATDRSKGQPRRAEHVPGRYRHARGEDRAAHAHHDERHAVRDRARRRGRAGGEPDRQGRRGHAAGAVLDHRRAGSTRPAAASASPNAASIWR